MTQRPSIFAPNGAERPQWTFLHYFARTLRAKPELPEIDYVPTQVVTEYFLKVFGQGRFFDGLQYMSDVDGGDRCVVIDVANSGCVDLEQGWTDSSRLQLALLPDTLRTVPVQL